ncbi:hypothetical protein DPMN_108694 [Dreissena polymorpha]|uniref:Uncharacterized protein n=1 Tax=Dreissena polymorpha TaxID=45954 RepID=A0A9D4K8Z5_DREPO|nr:hypothetical protein DPMN_108694 [Dreissena polymorpha]
MSKVAHLRYKGTDLFCAAQDIIRTNVLIKVLTRINSPPPGGHVFQQTGNIFILIKDIIKSNILTKFHDDWTINVTFRMLTSHVFQQTGTKFHDDRTINMASRVLTRNKRCVCQKHNAPYCAALIY